MQEVVALIPGLQTFADRDAGFRQFIDRYEVVSADPETRREYAVWFDEALREEGMLDWARQEVRDEYEPKLAEAERKRKDDMVSAARVMKNRGVSYEIIAEAYPSLAGEIETL